MSDGFTREPTLRPIAQGDLLSDEVVQQILDELRPDVRELLTRHIMACEREWARKAGDAPQ